MRFLKVRLVNIGPYHDPTEIQFSTDRTRNIVVFFGNNGSGKTSFMKAIIWTLYGSKEANEKFDYFCRKARGIKDAYAEAELVFEHQGRTYRMNRRLEKTSPSVSSGTSLKETCSLYVDGEKRDNAAELISQILPEDASQFFFFDADQLSRYTNPRDWNRIKSAIECVLGIPTVRSAADDLVAVRSHIESDYTQCLKADEKSASLGEKRAKIQEDIENERKTITDLKEKSEKQRANISAIEAERAQYLAMTDILKEIARIEGRLQEQAKKRQELGEKKREALDSAYLFLLHDQIRAAMESIEAIEHEGQAREKEVRKYEAVMELIGTILGKRKCICGTDVGTGEEMFLKRVADTAKSKIEEFKSKASPLASSDLPNLQMQGLVRKAVQARNDLLAVEKEIIDVKLDIDKATDERGKLRKKISTEAEKRIPDVEAKLGAANEGLTELERKEGFHEGKLSQLGQDLDRIDKDIRRTRASTPAIDMFDRARGIAKSAEEAFRSIVDWMALDKRTMIQSRTTQVHQSVTNKPQVWKEVRINEDFTMDIIDCDGKAVPKQTISEGEKQILAFSFIAGLTHSSTSDSPVAMDSPFIRLDPDHRSNIIAFLPRLAEQVFLFVLPEVELEMSEIKTGPLRNSIAQVFSIEFDQKRRASTIREVTG